MRAFLLYLFFLTLATIGAATSAQTQDMATLIADNVALDGQDRLVAQGNVEVFHDGKRLKAARILYDRTTDRLNIEGPIVLSDSGQALVVADQADLSADLTEGVLRSARMVLNRQLQLSTSELQRIGGRYTQLGRSVVSSCKICADNPTPLWEIRAKRVIHDQLERQIYFDGAQLRFGGVPVFWLPYLRMPDPTLDRARGFLMPSLLTTSDLGTGIKTPYFFPLGDNRDITVTPFITTKGARSLELRYRQAFNNGRIDISGAISRDDILPDKTRSYLVAQGIFALPRDFLLTFRAETVSDRSYLLDYEISDKDRLDSQIEIMRTRRNEHISARLISFHSIRAGEVNSTLPSIVADFTWERRFAPRGIGGEAGLRFQTYGHFRSSDSPLDPDGDGISDGRDVGRMSLNADWRRNWILGGGVLASILGEVTADFYNISQDALFEGSRTRLHGGLAAELRWPLLKTQSNGVTHVIEPVAQLIWSPRKRRGIPSEDSALVEFDEGNLFTMSRFPGADKVERGLRANVGLGYTRHDPDGWSLGLTFGRVFRKHDLGQFGVASGLDGRNSDWLAALRLTTADGLALTNRMVFDNDLNMSKTELRIDLDRENYGIGSSYVWMLADPSESRATRVSEMVFDGRYQFTPNWLGQIHTRYDFEADRAASAGVVMQFRNECMKVDLSLSRRFTTSTALRPTTRFGLSVDLLGFGGSATGGPARPCRG
ncbi:MAG: LPS-assembly protein LptD [Pseudorhodobacter sp.]